MLLLTLNNCFVEILSKHPLIYGGNLVSANQQSQNLVGRDV